MIHHVQGDLLKSDCDVIVHQSNCVGGFGGGIAGQIRKQLPYAYEAFAADTRTSQEKLGNYSVGRGDLLKPTVYNAYGQFDCGGFPGVVYTDYEALEHALIQIFTEIKNIEYLTGNPKKVGMPYLIGCGLAGGSWEIVFNILTEVSEKMGHDIHLYEFIP